MAKLTTKKRNALKSSTFGLPGSRKYPMPDKVHAVRAKGRATQAVNAGRMSTATEAKIDRKADAILHKHGANHEKMAHATEKMPHTIPGDHRNVRNPESHGHKLQHG